MTATINATTSSGVVLTPDNSGNLALQSAGTAGATITAYGIGLGTEVPASGMGIKFPATQVPSSDANTLDDYEEGSYTPALFGTNSDPTLTYANRLGRYIKVGKMVYVFYFIQWTGYSGGSGAIRMTLPIVSDGTAAYYPSGHFSDFNGLSWGPSYTMLQGEIYPNSSLMYFLVSGSGTSSTGLQAGAFASSGYFYGTAVYQSAS